MAVRVRSGVKKAAQDGCGLILPPGRASGSGFLSFGQEDGAFEAIAADDRHPEEREAQCLKLNQKVLVSLIQFFQDIPDVGQIIPISHPNTTNSLDNLMILSIFLQKTENRKPYNTGCGPIAGEPMICRPRSFAA